MNKYIGIILLVIIVTDIMDGDFTNPTIVDYVKIPLIIICLVLLMIKVRKEKRE